MPVSPRTASRREWFAQRLDLLAKEKEFTRARDALAAARRQLPWVKVEKDYVFDAPEGKVSLPDLFAGRSQLVIYHFMFHPDWQAGCKSCSFWSESFDAVGPHLAQRDVSLAAVSRAPLDKLIAFQKRMGWHFRWVSSAGGDFNFDYRVSFEPDDPRQADYNFGTVKFPGQEAPGISVFARGDDGAIYHTYSAYSRGLDMLNPTYQLLDIVPKGRDEDALSYPMEWVRLHDEYPAA
ncbi:MAG: DUF899 domain-containing protein [Rhizobiaceae bacterium]|nr:DUF899 domain-containing protein [Rhizobiaceae bacterium]